MAPFSSGCPGCGHPVLTWPSCLQERLPTVPLSGMYNKSGGKVRLTFKLEQDQLWIGTKGTFNYAYRSDTWLRIRISCLIFLQADLV